MQLVLRRDELLVRRDADHALHETPVLPPERMPVEGVPQQADRDEREPPTRKVQHERVRAIDGDHVFRRFGAAESPEVRHFLRRQRHVPVVLYEELELPAHVIDVAHARTSARDSWFGVIVTRIRPGNRSTTWTKMRMPWPRPSSYVSRRMRPNRPSVSSERFFEASISSSGKSWSTAYITTPRLWKTRFTRTS